ncbi:unnamed protein product [Symbiodinium sp. KB8]|nr:unnamed protein product [Symbiodinium sp. KB8]
MGLRGEVFVESSSSSSSSSRRGVHVNWRCRGLKLLACKAEHRAAKRLRPGSKFRWGYWFLGSGCSQMAADPLHSPETGTFQTAQSVEMVSSNAALEGESLADINEAEEPGRVMGTTEAWILAAAGTYPGVRPWPCFFGLGLLQIALFAVRRVDVSYPVGVCLAMLTCVGARTPWRLQCVVAAVALAYLSRLFRRKPPQEHDLEGTWVPELSSSLSILDISNLAGDYRSEGVYSPYFLPLVTMTVMVIVCIYMCVTRTCVCGAGSAEILLAAALPGYYVATAASNLQVGISIMPKDLAIVVEKPTAFLAIVAFMTAGFALNGISCLVHLEFARRQRVAVPTRVLQSAETKRITWRILVCSCFLTAMAHTILLALWAIGLSKEGEPPSSLRNLVAIWWSAISSFGTWLVASWLMALPHLATCILLQGELEHVETLVQSAQIVRYHVRSPEDNSRTVDTFLMTTNKANNDYDVPGGGVTSGSLPTERMVLLLQLGTMSQMVMRPRAGPGRCPTMARGITGRDRIIPSTRDGTGRSGTTAGNGKTGDRSVLRVDKDYVGFYYQTQLFGWWEWRVALVLQHVPGGDEGAKDPAGALLYQALSGRAWIEAEELQVSELATEDGVEKYKAWIMERYQEIEVGKIAEALNGFFKRLRRSQGQSIREFNASFDRAYARLIEVDCRLPETAKAWAYLNALALNHTEELTVLGSVANEYVTAKLQRAAVLHEKSLKCPWDKDRPRPWDKDGGGLRTFGKANSAMNTDHADEEPPWAGSSEDLDVAEDEEARVFEAYMTAKHQYRDILRSRGLDQEGIKRATEDRIALAKSKSFCSVCKQKGHWHRDAECPARKGAPGNADSDKSGGKIQTAHAIFETNTNLGESLLAITDCACTKSVMGTSWLQRYVDVLRGMNVEVPLLPEQDNFRFGTSRIFASSYAVVVPFRLGSSWVLLRASVVHGDLPLLVSRSALAALGMVYDLDNHVADFSAVQVSGHPLLTTPSGHPALNVHPGNQGLPPHVHPKMWDAKKSIRGDIQIVAHQEAYMVGRFLGLSELHQVVAAYEDHCRFLD